MLRATILALATATLLGTAAASAAPIQGIGITGAVQANAPVERVWWRYHRHHHHHYFRRGWRRW